MLGPGGEEISKRLVVGVFQGEGGVVGVVWQVESEHIGGGVERLEVGTLAGALVLRGVGLVFEEDEGKGGTDSWRSFVALRGQAVGANFGVRRSCERCVLESLLFGSFMRELQ